MTLLQTVLLIMNKMAGKMRHLLESNNAAIQKLAGKAPDCYRDDIARRDILIRQIFTRLDQGIAWHNAIQTPLAARHGERVAEYTWVADLLRKLRPATVLDVGCVLNNRVIANQIHGQISFLNPAAETVIYKRYTYYKMPLSEWRNDRRFALVTCLSTLEHIGFDNTRYGIHETDQGWCESRCIEEIVRSIKQLLMMVEPGGHLLISCPYGRNEYVVYPPVTGVRTSQVLHRGHVQALQQQFCDGQLEIMTFRLSGSGWEQHAWDGDYSSYGSIGPGASGLILIFGKG